MQEVEEVHNLLYREGRTGLLAIAKGRVGNKEFFGRGDRDDLMVEIDAADLIIGENVALQVGLGHVLQGISPELGVLMVQDPAFIIPLGHGLTLWEKIFPPELLR